MDKWMVCLGGSKRASLSYEESRVGISAYVVLLKIIA